MVRFLGSVPDKLNRILTASCLFELVLHLICQCRCGLWQIYLSKLWVAPLCCHLRWDAHHACICLPAKGHDLCTCREMSTAEVLYKKWEKQFRKETMIWWRKYLRTQTKKVFLCTLRPRGITYGRTRCWALLHEDRTTAANPCSKTRMFWVESFRSRVKCSRPSCLAPRLVLYRWLPPPQPASAGTGGALLHTNTSTNGKTTQPTLPTLIAHSMYVKFVNYAMQIL